MAQRLLTAFSLIVAVAALGMMVLVWNSMNANQQLMVASLDANRELLSQLGESNTRLMEQLAATQRDAPTTPTSIEWVPCEVELRHGSKDGPPAAGVDVRFTSPNRPAGVRDNKPESLMPVINATTDENGHVDLGLVHYGYYEIQLKMPWEEYASIDVTVHPGKPMSEVIVVPAEPLRPVDVQVRVNWPEDFNADDIVVACWRDDRTRELEGLTWYSRDPHRYDRFARQGPALIGPADEMMSTTLVGSSRLDLGGNDRIKVQVGSDEHDGMPLDRELLQIVEEIQIPDAGYRFYGIAFLIRVDPSFVRSPLSSDAVPYAYVPDTYLDAPANLLDFTDGDTPELSLNVPSKVINEIKSFRAVMEADVEAAAEKSS